MGNGDAEDQASGFGCTRWGLGVGWVLCLPSSERGVVLMARFFILTSIRLRVRHAAVVDGRSYPLPAAVRSGGSVSVVWCTVVRDRLEDR